MHGEIYVVGEVRREEPVVSNEIWVYLSTHLLLPFSLVNKPLECRGNTSCMSRQVSRARKHRWKDGIHLDINHQEKCRSIGSTKERCHPLRWHPPEYRA